MTSKPIVSRTLPAWLNYIQTLYHREMELDLSRIRQIPNISAYTHFQQPVIIVGGSNGKGTTASLICQIYQQAGYRVGLYTSPHILRYNERIQYQSQPISDDALSEAFARVEDLRENTPLTFFEFFTLAACVYFHNLPADVLIFEVGMGGRLDAVNCLKRDLSIITTISLEHQRWLGDTREAIAREKAGIIQPGIPIICGDENPPPIIAEIAAREHSPYYALNRDYYFTEANMWAWHSNDVHYADLAKPLMPRQNAATALMAIHLLQARLPVSAPSVYAACRLFTMPGRMQLIQSPHPTLLDVAHNPAASAYIASQIPHVYPCSGKRIALFSILADKDIRQTIMPMLGLIDRWVIAPILDARAASVSEMQAMLAELTGAPVQVETDIATAYRQLCREVSKQDHIVVFGSFHTVGEVLASLNNV